jgi:two-component sensor histidine kinase
VSWEIARDRTPQLLTLLWSESGGPGVTQPSRRGFGSKLIELSLEHGLGAKVRREFRESGLRCAIEIDLDRDVGRWRPKTTNVLQEGAV